MICNNCNSELMEWLDIHNRKNYICKYCQFTLTEILYNECYIFSSNKAYMYFGQLSTSFHYMTTQIELPLIPIENIIKNNIVDFIYIKRKCDNILLLI